MSRSYKKPYYTDQQNGDTIWIKRKASRKVRHIKFEDTPQQKGKKYEKVFDSWNIRDWSSYSKDPKAKRK